MSSQNADKIPERPTAGAYLLHDELVHSWLGSVKRDSGPFKWKRNLAWVSCLVLITAAVVIWSLHELRL